MVPSFLFLVVAVLGKGLKMTVAGSGRIDDEPTILERLQAEFPHVDLARIRALPGRASDVEVNRWLVALGHAAA